MAKKKAAVKTAGRRKQATVEDEQDDAIFPVKATLKWPDGSKTVLEFAKPTRSARGNLNAWAGGRLVRDGNIFRINCNVTKSKN